MRRELRIDDPLAAAERSVAASGEHDDRSVAGRLRVIPVDVIDANPNQPRRRFDESALAALADSIRERGVLQPVIVRPLGDRYSLVAGERRWRAAQLAGLPAIPALVDDAAGRAGIAGAGADREPRPPGPEPDRGGPHVRGAARRSAHDRDRAGAEGRAQSRGHRQHGPAPRSARRGDRAGRHRCAEQGARQGAVGRARASPPPPARPPRHPERLVSQSAGGRHRAGQRRRRHRVVGPAPIRSRWRSGCRTRSRGRSGRRPRPSRTATGFRSSSTRPPPRVCKRFSVGRSPDYDLPRDPHSRMPPAPS